MSYLSVGCKFGGPEGLAGEPGLRGPAVSGEQSNAGKVYHHQCRPEDVGFLMQRSAAQ